MTGEIERTEAGSIVNTADRVDDTGQCSAISRPRLNTSQRSLQFTTSACNTNTNYVRWRLEQIQWLTNFERINDK